MNVFDIALGVFFALLARDIINLFATLIAEYVENKRADRELEEFLENLEHIRATKPKKKTAKKK